MHNGHVVPILKAASSGEFSGIAWSFQTVPDAAGDVILPLALTTVACPIPVYTEHDGVSVGEIRKAEVTEEGLHVEGRIVVYRLRAKVRAGAHLHRRGDCRGKPVPAAGELRLPSHHAKELAHSRQRNRT